MVKVSGYDKPWFTRNMKIKMKQMEEAFKSDDLVQKAKYDVERAIRKANTYYRRKIEGQFLSNDTRAVWQGLQ